MVVLLGVSSGAAAASPVLFTWDFTTVASALATADYGATFSGGELTLNCTDLADCAVVGLYLAPQLPAGTVNILGAFGPDTWATNISGAEVQFAPADPAAPVRFITDAENINGSFAYGSLVSSVAGPVRPSRFGILVSFIDDTAPLPSSIQWAGTATVVGLNADGTQRLFGIVGKDISADFTLDSEYSKAVPEPGTLLLSGLGLAAILPAIRKRRRPA